MMSRMEYITRYAHGAAAHHYTYLIFSLKSHEIGNPPHLFYPSYDIDIPLKYSIFKNYRQHNISSTSSDTYLMAKYFYEESRFIYTPLHPNTNTFVLMYVHVRTKNVKYITMYFIQYLLSTSLLYSHSDVKVFMSSMIMKTPFFSPYTDTSTSGRNRMERVGTTRGMTVSARGMSIGDDDCVVISDRRRYIDVYGFTALVSHHLRNTTVYSPTTERHTVTTLMLRTHYPAHHTLKIGGMNNVMRTLTHVYIPFIDTYLETIVLIKWAESS